MVNKGLLFLTVFFMESLLLFSGPQVILDRKDTEFLNLGEVQVLSRGLSFSHASLSSVNDYTSVESIDGDLVLLNMSGTVSGSLFPSLTGISGDLVVIGNRELETISFPALVKVGGDIVIRDNTVLKALDFPSLTQSGALEISRQNRVSLVDFPALESAEKIQLEDLLSFSQVNFPLLETLESLFVSRCSGPLIKTPSLRVVSDYIQVLNSVTETDFSSLQSCGSLVLRNLTSAALSLPLTESLGGRCEITGCGFSAVTLPLLGGIGGSVYISRNEELTSVTLLSLKEVGGEITVWENPLLSGVRVSNSLALGRNNEGVLRFLDNNKRLTEREPLLRSLRRSGWAGSLVNGEL